MTSFLEIYFVKLTEQIIVEKDTEKNSAGHFLLTPSVHVRFFMIQKIFVQLILPWIISNGKGLYCLVYKFIFWHMAH